MKKRITALMEWFAYRVKKRKFISYEKATALKIELGEDPDPELTTLEVLKIFYSNDPRQWTECISEFNDICINQQYSGHIDLDLNFENKEARYYIRAKIYESNSNLVELYNHLSGSNKKDLDIRFAKRVRHEFLKSVEHFKELYEWIYNPPILPGINKHTIGKQLRSEFQQHYGAYAEITYLLACGNALEFDRVNKMPLNEYLALGEYVLRKRAVENIE